MLQSVSRANRRKDHPCLLKRNYDREEKAKVNAEKMGKREKKGMQEKKTKEEQQWRSEEKCLA